MGLATRKQFGMTVLLAALLTGAFAGLTLYDAWTVPLLDYHLPGLLFIDWYAITSAVDAHQHGFDVSSFHPYDYFWRPHVYSGLWLHLGLLGFDRFDGIFVGLGLLVAFLAVLVLLIRPQDGRELAIGVGFGLTPPVLLGMERLNNDLLLFILLGLAVPWFQRGRWGLPLAAGVFALATVLKFYPVILFPVLFVMFGFGWRVWAWAISGLAAAGAYTLLSGDWTGPLAMTIPRPGFFYAMGAENLFFVWLNPQWVADARLGPLLAVLVATVIAWRVLRSEGGAEAEPGGEALVRRNLCVVGAVLVLGCFTLRSGFSYRLVFLGLCLPQVLAWLREPTWSRESKMLIITFAVATYVGPLARHIYHSGAARGIWSVSQASFEQTMLVVVGLAQWALMIVLGVLLARMLLWQGPLRSVATWMNRRWPTCAD